MKPFAIAVAVFVGWMISGCSLRVVQNDDADVRAALTDVLDQYQYRASLAGKLIAAVNVEAMRERPMFEAVAAVQSGLSATLAAQHMVDDPVMFQRFEVSERQLTDSLSRLTIAIDEDHRLAGDTKCHRLKDLLFVAQGRIAMSRDRYDEAVERYNAALDLPTHDVAGRVLGYRRRLMFDIPDLPAANHQPRVDFGSLRGSLRV